MPIYRPLAYLSIWAQEQIGGFYASQFTQSLPNLAVWIAAVLALYALVYSLTRSRLAGLLAAGVFAIDERVQTATVWIGESQSTLACLLGLVALVAVVRFGASPRRRVIGAVFGALLLSGLAKEYGLAFVVAAPLLAFAWRRARSRAVSVAAAGALLTYAVMRFAIAGGAAGGYCEDMGLYRHEHRVCYSSLAFGDRLEQHVYNILASFAGTVFPQLFDGLGAWHPATLRAFVVPSLVLLLALVGAVKAPRAALPLLGLVVANAFLSFLLYRTRNQIIGMAGLYGAAGVGAAALLATARSRVEDRRVAAPLAAGLLVVFGWMAWHATRTDYPIIDSYRRSVFSIDPCEYLRQFPQSVNREVVYHLKVANNLDNPTCSGR